MVDQHSFLVLSVIVTEYLLHEKPVIICDHTFDTLTPNSSPLI